jgi:hypothetical protein
MQSLLPSRSSRDEILYFFSECISKMQKSRIAEVHKPRVGFSHAYTVIHPALWRSNRHNEHGFAPPILFSFLSSLSNPTAAGHPGAERELALNGATGRICAAPCHRRAVSTAGVPAVAPRFHADAVAAATVELAR